MMIHVVLNQVTVVVMYVKTSNQATSLFVKFCLDFQLLATFNCWLDSHVG
mgnify:CR=1 FL=1